MELAPYDRSKHNGIVIVCHQCGCEFEETDEGFYQPIVCEEDKHNRICKHCRNYNLG